MISDPQVAIPCVRVLQKQVYERRDICYIERTFGTWDTQEAGHGFR